MFDGVSRTAPVVGAAAVLVAVMFLGRADRRGPRPYTCAPARVRRRFGS
ncbi:hypothetical protein [Dietzia natronolimnaea]